MLQAMLGDRTALIPEPTFGEYSRAFPNRMTYQAARFQRIKDLPPNKVAAADIVVFVNPNNPTGLSIPSEEIMELARQKPDKLILVDESFADFSGQRSVQDLLQEDALPNVWVLKSLSKCLGVPGMRLGYVYSRDEEAIKRLNEQIPVWNSNSLVEYFLESILKHRRTLAESFRSTIADRETFTEELRAIAAVDEVYPSSANFLLVRLKLSAAQVQDLRIGLLNRWNCYVKDCSAKFDDGRAYLRIAVRLAAENTRFAQALESEGARIMGSPTMIKAPELYRRLPAA
jgi:histidinol-phosphate/aromatic aminotransferase/cobyric acid decarboxylase-like protein